MAEPTLTLVDCAPLSARLTERSCVKRWRSAQGAEPPAWDSLRHCHTCPIGALRAGETAAVARNAAIVAAVSHYCPRCDRVAARLINGRTCVSCYNRTREAVMGLNAKGTRPRIADVIHAEALALGAERLVTVDRVATRVEAAVVAARQVGPGAIIGVPPLFLPFRGWQASLYLVPGPRAPLFAAARPALLKVKRQRRKRGQVPLDLLDMMELDAA
jgi:hypothetical protein